MSATVTHAFVSGISDGGDATVVRPSNWNASHIVTGLLPGSVGTSFPGGPATNDLFYRTDLAQLFYWDGTRWLTTELFYATVGAISISATSVGTRFGAAMNTGLDLWVVAADLSVGVFGTNNGSNFWTYTIDKRASNDGATAIFTADTSAITASTWTRVSTSIAASVAISTAFNFIVQATVKTGAPANLQIAGGFTYRLIGT